MQSRSHPPSLWSSVVNCVGRKIHASLITWRQPHWSYTIVSHSVWTWTRQYSTLMWDDRGIVLFSMSHNTNGGYSSYDSFTRRVGCLFFHTSLLSTPTFLDKMFVVLLHLGDLFKLPSFLVCFASGPAISPNVHKSVCARVRSGKNYQKQTLGWIFFFVFSSPTASLHI